MEAESKCHVSGYGVERVKCCVQTLPQGYKLFSCNYTGAYYENGVPTLVSVSGAALSLGWCGVGVMVGAPPLCSQVQVSTVTT